MEKSRKTLKTITISEVEFLHDEELESEKTVTRFIVNVEVPDDSTRGMFESLAEAEEYASDVAKRPLKSIKKGNGVDLNALMRGKR